MNLTSARVTATWLNSQLESAQEYVKQLRRGTIEHIKSLEESLYSDYLEWRKKRWFQFGKPLEQRIFLEEARRWDGGTVQGFDTGSTGQKILRFRRVLGDFTDTDFRLCYLATLASPPHTFTMAGKLEDIWIDLSVSDRLLLHNYAKGETNVRDLN